jgi:hypothetical protein
MSNKVLLKKSSVVGKAPATTDLDYGEVALNYADGLLYFKTANNIIQSFDSSSVTLNGTQTLTNKTLTAPTINSGTANNLTLTGTLTAGASTGSNGQFLKSTGSGIVWATPGGSTLVSLSDVSITTPVTSQVLTYNGSVWINSTPNAQVASAIFASSAYDMGFVYDVASISEDEGLVTGSNNYVYDLGILSFTGIISLNNLDQSVKSDYLGYSIIFGF